MLEIRRASANLNNLGSFRMPELDNGSARAFAAQADAAKTAAAAVRAAGQATVEGISRRGEIVARTLGSLGKSMVEFATEMRDREDDRVVTKALAEKSAWRQKEVAGDMNNGVPGIFDQKIDNPAEWQEQQRQALIRINEEVTKDMTSRQRELFNKRNIMNDIAWDGRVAAHRAKTQMALEVGEAKELEFTTREEAAKMYADPAYRDSKIDDHFDAVKKRLDAEMTPDALRPAEFRKAGLQLILDSGKYMVDDWKVKTSAMSPEATREFFDEGIKKAKDNGFLISNKRLKDALGSGGLTETEEKLLLSRLEKARNEAVHGAEAREREANKAVVMDFTERELKLRDVPQELWADAYDEMGKDEKLKKAFPERAMAYRDAAAKMREAEKKARAQASADAIKANEDRIYGRLIDFIYAKKFGLLSGQAAADEQAAVWRDFRVAVTGKAVGKDFPDRFTARLDKELNDQQAEAMRYTMQLFGYDAETDSRGRVGAAERNKATNNGLTFKTPFKKEGWFWDSQPTISASQLFDVLDRQWRLLDGQDKGGNRLEAAKKMAEGAKEDWMHGGYDGMIEGMADAFMQNEVNRRSGEEYREAE